MVLQKIFPQAPDDFDAALADFGIERDGSKHRALDNAKAMAQLCLHLKRKGAKFNELGKARDFKYMAKHLETLFECIRAKC